jgi:hypothetical protein
MHGHHACELQPTFRACPRMRARRQSPPVLMFHFQRAKLVGMARLARGAEQFVLVGPQLLFGQIALGRYEPKFTAQRVTFGASGNQRLVLLSAQRDGGVRRGRLDHSVRVLFSSFARNIAGDASESRPDRFRRAASATARR